MPLLSEVLSSSEKSPSPPGLFHGRMVFLRSGFFFILKVPPAVYSQYDAPSAFPRSSVVSTLTCWRLSLAVSCAVVSISAEARRTVKKIWAPVTGLAVCWCRREMV